MNRYHVGRRIELFRNKLKISTQQLAVRINRSQATISRIENGKQGVNIELLVKIADELHVHPFALLNDEPIDRPASTQFPVGASPTMVATGGNDYGEENAEPENQTARVGDARLTSSAISV